MSSEPARTAPQPASGPASDPGTVAIRLSGVAKAYRLYPRPLDRLKQALVRSRTYFQEIHALAGVDLEIRRGETVGIVGRNGSGKSTLLQIVAGTLTPSAGEVAVAGRVAALLELGAGFNPEFTGAENVRLNAAVLGLSAAEIEERFPAIVAFAEIGPFIDHPVRTYSSGMYIRLAFAVAISIDPDILIVDEALSVGDEAFQRKCFGRIEAIQRNGGTILFVSHSASSVVQLCNRAVLMDGGRVLMTGLPKPVVAQYHRLLYAPAEHVPRLRAEIARLDAAGAQPEPAEPEPATPQPDVPAVGPAVSPADADTPAGAWFDPHLRSSSRTVYESRGAEIGLPRLETPDGRTVNHLVRGRQSAFQRARAPGQGRLPV